MWSSESFGPLTPMVHWPMNDCISLKIIAFSIFIFFFKQIKRDQVFWCFANTVILIHISKDTSSSSSYQWDNIYKTVLEHHDAIKLSNSVKKKDGWDNEDEMLNLLSLHVSSLFTVARCCISQLLNSIIKDTNRMSNWRDKGEQLEVVRIWVKCKIL